MPKYLTMMHETNKIWSAGSCGFHAAIVQHVVWANVSWNGQLELANTRRIITSRFSRLYIGDQSLQRSHTRYGRQPNETASVATETACCSNCPSCSPTAAAGSTAAGAATATATSVAAAATMIIIFTIFNNNNTIVVFIIINNNNNNSYLSNNRWKHRCSTTPLLHWQSVKIHTLLKMNKRDQWFNTSCAFKSKINWWKANRVRNLVFYTK